MSQYAIVIEGDGSTNYSAYAPDLPGVVATGETLEECEAAMREAIEFHIEGLRLAGESVPPATSHVAVSAARAARRAALKKPYKKVLTRRAGTALSGPGRCLT